MKLKSVTFDTLRGSISQRIQFVYSMLERLYGRTVNVVNTNEALSASRIRSWMSL